MFTVRVPSLTVRTPPELGSQKNGRRPLEKHTLAARETANPKTN